MVRGHSPTHVRLAVAIVSIALLLNPSAADDSSSFGTCYGPSSDCLRMTKESCLTSKDSWNRAADCKWFSFTNVIVGFIVLGAYSIILTSTLLWMRFCRDTDTKKVTPTDEEEWKQLTYKEKIKAKKQQQAMEAHGSLSQNLLLAD